MIPVSVRGLTISSARGEIMRGVDLEVAAGAAVALVGPSGIGKSTLAHALLGDVPDGLSVTSGSIRIGGLDPLSLRGRGLRNLRRRCANVDQDPGAALPPHRTVRAILAERARPASVFPPSRLPHQGLSDDDAVRLLHDLGLKGVDGILDRRPSELSGGQRRRVGVAAGLAAAPELLVIDEPTAGVDAAAVTLMLDTLRRARERTNATIVVITHDPAVAHALADDIHEFGPAGHIDDGDGTHPPHVAAHNIRAGEPQAPVADREPRAALEVRDLVVDRGGRRVIDGVSLSVRPGGAVALSGPSGAGKKTALRSILGLVPAAAGRIIVDGAEVPLPLARRLRRLRSEFGWVPQEAELALNPSVPVGVALRRTGAPAKEVRAMLDALGLPDVRRSRPDDLSGGQRQRVGVAVALLRKPRILVCDEPTSALDAESTGMVLRALAGAQACGTAVVLASHDPAALATADEVVAVESR